MVPNNRAHAMALDEENGNKKWFDAERLELKQINEYDTFTDEGKLSKPLPGYKQIKVHFVYDVKHDERLKVRLVSGEHLTPVPIESVIQWLYL